MKIILILLSFFVVLSFQSELITIDMQLNNNKTYIIKNIDDKLNVIYDEKININILPQKILILIKHIFINNNIMGNCFSIKYQEYDSFYCKKKEAELKEIKLNLNFNNYIKTIKGSELFSQKNNFYFFKFYTKSNITNIIFSSKEYQYNNNNLRILKSDNETDIINKSDNVTNNKEEADNKSKSGIGWLGISLIILLSLIVIYIIYVGFRYYRRKKYQNPSFYYKITEEMFDDITPIE